MIYPARVYGILDSLQSNFYTCNWPYAINMFMLGYGLYCTSFPI